MAAVNDDPASLDGAKPGTRAIVRVLAFAAVAAMTSFVVGWLVGDGSFRHWLFSCAGSLEFWGVLLVASPELVPYLRRLATGLGALWHRTKALARRATDWVRVKIGRPRTQVVYVEGIDSGAMSGSGRLSVGVREGATMEEKVDFLLRRDQETQERLADLQERLGALPERWRGDMEATAGTLRHEQREGLDALRDEHLTARVGGVVFLVVGLILATWSNLIEPGSRAVEGAVWYL